MKNKSVVYMKDSWRIAAKDIAKEGEIYAKLEAANVPYLAGFLGGGDVSSDVELLGPPEQTDASATSSPGDNDESSFTRVQRTLTAEYSNCSWAGETSEHLRTLVHHRIVLKKVGRPLRQFASTKELVTAIYHAVLCKPAIIPFYTTIDGVRILTRSQ